MCGRKKRDPRIDEEQEKARQSAEAAKEQALAAQEAQREKQLESEREAAASAEATSQANAGKAARQSELETQAGRTKGLFASKAARRRSSQQCHPFVASQEAFLSTFFPKRYCSHNILQAWWLSLQSVC